MKYQISILRDCHCFDLCQLAPDIKGVSATGEPDWFDIELIP